MLVKVCGLTDPSQAKAVAHAGADWIGLNFHPDSPRYVTEEQAAAIIAELPENCVPVGLFVDRPLELVEAVSKRLGLFVVQLHGQEPPGDVKRLRQAGLKVVKAFRVADAEGVEQMLNDLRLAHILDAAPYAVLVDALVPGLSGGTGKTHNETVLQALRAATKQGLDHLILAGGLRPENVAEQVELTRPWMVDVASGVEAQPGQKDLEMVAAFIKAARSA